MIVLPLVSEEEVQVMDIVDVQPVVQGIGPLEVHSVCRTAGSRADALVRRIAWE